MCTQSTGLGLRKRQRTSTRRSTPRVDGAVQKGVAQNHVLPPSQTQAQAKPEGLVNDGGCEIEQCCLYLGIINGRVATVARATIVPQPRQRLLGTGDAGLQLLLGERCLREPPSRQPTFHSNQTYFKTGAADTMIARAGSPVERLQHPDTESSSHTDEVLQAAACNRIAPRMTACWQFHRGP